MKILTIIFLILLASFAKFQPTPRYGMAEGPYQAHYFEATRLIAIHGNSDGFYDHMRKKRKYFSHTDGTVEENIAKFRADLAKAEFIPIDVMVGQRKDFLGGWMPVSKVMKMNVGAEQTDIQKAATLLHETTHKYGWNHKGNEWHENDNVNSFPYAVHLDFEEYLKIQEAKYPRAK